MADDNRKRSRRPGRPLSPGAGRAIVAAVTEVLSETGFSGLTLSAVAERAGVGKATIYRRWASKDELVATLIRERAAQLPSPDTGSTGTDLVTYLRGLAELVGTPPAPQVLRGLFSEILRNRALADAYHEAVLERRALNRAILERGVERGELRADIDYELALDMLTGPIYMRVLVTGSPIPPDYPEEVVDALLRAFGRRPD